MGLDTIIWQLIPKTSGTYDFSKGINMARTTGNVGIGTTSPTALLHVNGSLYVNGTATQLTGTWGSDQMFKTDIDSISNALAIIKQLKPKTYYFDTTNVWGLNFGSKKNYGFIAQDIEIILPELVSSTTKNADVDTSGNVVHPAVTYKSLNYNAFISILTKGIQEQSNEIDSLTTKTHDQDSINASLQNAATSRDSTITSLKNQMNQLITKTNNQDSLNTILQNQLMQLSSLINDCCNSHGNNGNGNNLMPSGTNNYKSTPADSGAEPSPTPLTDIELSNKNMVILNQNVANPFTEQTTISYYLPDNIQHAQILFFDQSGKIIKTVDLKEKGKGILNVFASDLSNGIYMYSLIIDGQTVETKKMVKQ